jgi:transketolase
MINTEKIAKNIRINSLKMVHKAKASHIGSALSIVDIVAVLYGDVMRINSKNPKDENRDRFILSKGHACVAVYAALAEFNIIPFTDLESYGDNFSWLMNHISHKVPGVEFSTGALGHGLPFAAGKALSAKINKSKWQIYVLLSDGEMDEGSNWEALMFASHNKLSNLNIIIDYNKLQSLDTVQNTLSLEPLADKLRAFGCEVIEVNGHNHMELHSAFLKKNNSIPKVIIAHTIKGKGVSFMENKIEWHYKNPNDDQLALALAEIERAYA